MGILDSASGKSAYLGYEYYKDGKVKDLQRAEDGFLTARVLGSGDNVYDVVVDTAHPKRSQCTCPHATGRQVVCKHKVAAYFAAFPEEAKRYIKELEDYWAEEEQRQQEVEDELDKFVRKMKKSELQEALLGLLYTGPDWQYDRFVKEHMLDIDTDDPYNW